MTWSVAIRAIWTLVILSCIVSIVSEWATAAPTPAPVAVLASLYCVESILCMWRRSL